MDKSSMVEDIAAKAAATAAEYNRVRRSLDMIALVIASFITTRASKRVAQAYRSSNDETMKAETLFDDWIPNIIVSGKPVETLKRSINNYFVSVCIESEADTEKQQRDSNYPERRARRHRHPIHANQHIAS